MPHGLYTTDDQIIRHFQAEIQQSERCVCLFCFHNGALNCVFSFIRLPSLYGRLEYFDGSIICTL